MDIKAIETRYADCRFRSRTEARWAVYFDALGIKWEYEKEGFELPSGRYLPDFWLPDHQAWAEVKGEMFTPEEISKLMDLVKHTGKPAVTLMGMPTVEQIAFISFNEKGKLNGRLTFMAPPFSKESPWVMLPYMHDHGFTATYLPPAQLQSQLEDACRAATSARFEFGECG